jgi:hypothetical protein
MNSGTELIGLLALGGFLALSSGCADHGPTNLYSQPVFGQSQSGANFQVDRIEEDALTVSPSAGVDGYVVWLRNVGNGGTVGPVTATLAVGLSYCASTVNYGASQATAVFGQKGLVINPGDRLRGFAVDNYGNIQNNQYSYVTGFVTPCAGAIVFNLAVSDTRGGAWNSNFSGMVQ